MSYEKITKIGCEEYSDNESSNYGVSLWEKGGKKRLYFNDYKRRGMGYIDVYTKEICNAYNSEWTSEMERYIAEHNMEVEIND